MIILIIHIIVSYDQNISLIFYVTSVLCLHYHPETVHCSTKDAYNSEITFLTLHPWYSCIYYLWTDTCHEKNALWIPGYLLSLFGSANAINIPLKDNVSFPVCFVGFVVLSILSGEIKNKGSNLKFIKLTISGLDKRRSKGLMRLILSGEIEQDELQPWNEGFCLRNWI